MVDDDRLRALWARVQKPPSVDEGLAASRQLVEILGTLAAEDPAKYQLQLANAWSFRAGMLEVLEVLEVSEAQPEAEEAFATSARLFRSLATESNPDSLFQLAGALQELARHQLTRDGRAQEALAAIQEAHDVCQRFARDDPKLSQDCDAIVDYLHAKACSQLGDHEAALAHGERAEAGLKRAERRDRDPEYRISLAENQRILARTMTEMNRLKDARKKMEDSAYLFGRLSKREPELYLGEFANATFLSAAILLAEGKGMRAEAAYNAAAKAYAEAVQHDPRLEEDYRTAVTALIDCYAGRGDHAMAERVRRRYAM